MKNTQKEKDTKEYTIEEAIKKLKNESKSKFDATVEVHINLDIDPNKQSIRFSTVLPHGTGKNKKIAVLSSEKIKEADILLTPEDLPKIEQGKIKPNIDFEILISEPKFMPILAKYAKILGPTGVMPNPKNGTVTEDIQKAIEQFKKGKIDIKTEKTAPIIHAVIGKISFDDKSLADNYHELLEGLKQSKPAKTPPSWIKSIFVTSTMGPSLKVKIG
ncbi:MAG TPA: 50S ribosomal protein L1 [bacterium]|jgi:large subunit ribosomal protein L1|nr:50S ribosomal protein L1 [bacterium]